MMQNLLTIRASVLTTSTASASRPRTSAPSRPITGHAPRAQQLAVFARHRRRVEVEVKLTVDNNIA